MNRASSATGWVRNPDGTLGYTWNPITGCLNGCEYCYARKLANTRLRERYLANENIAVRNGIITGSDITDKYQMVKFLQDPFYPRFWEDRLTEMELYTGVGKGIFVCDMSDLFGIGVPEEWTRKVFEAIKINQRNRFYLLTKQPQNLIKFSPFPDNCFVGVSTTNADMFINAGIMLEKTEAKIKFISVEPLLDWQSGGTGYQAHCLEKWGISWVIIGACTGTMKELLPLHHRTNLAMIRLNANKWILAPQIEWVQEIVQAADKAGIPVFLKNNLVPLLNANDNPDWAFIEVPVGDHPNCEFEAVLRQELPR